MVKFEQNQFEVKHQSSLDLKVPVLIKKACKGVDIIIGEYPSGVKKIWPLKLPGENFRTPYFPPQKFNTPYSASNFQTPYFPSQKFDTPYHFS